MKYPASLALALLVSCGGSGGGDSTPQVRHMTVVPGQQIQQTSDGQKMYIMPYKDLSTLKDALAKAAGDTWIYVWDELFWNDGAATQDQVAAAGHAVQAAGYKSAITILPERVLSETLNDPNAFNTIGVDIYPSGGIDWNTQGCTYNNNLYTTMLACSVKKLRAEGYTGEIWYLYQAFPGITADQERLQQETIAAAPGLGVAGIVAYNK